MSDLKRKADKIYQKVTKDDIKVGSRVKYKGNIGKVKELNHEGVKRFAKIDFDKENTTLNAVGKAGINTKELEKIESKKVEARRKLFRPGEILVRNSSDDFKIHKVVERKSRETFVTETFDKTGKFLGTSIRKYSELEDDSLIERVSNMDVNSVSEIISNMAEYRLENVIELLNSPTKKNLEKIEKIYREQDINIGMIKTLKRAIEQDRDKEDLEILIDAEKERIKEIQNKRKKGEEIPKEQKPVSLKI